MLSFELIKRLLDCLSVLKITDGAPRLDAEWLELRCRDTLTSDNIENISARVLIKDIERFLNEFPNILPPDLVADLTRPEPKLERGPWSRPEPW